MISEVLESGAGVMLREPTLADLDKSLNFFLSLPEDDRNYLRVDATLPEIAERRLVQAESGEVYRLWAFVEDQIAVDAALEFSGKPDERQGEFRVIVAPEHRQRGLGSLLLRQLFDVAEERGLERIVVKILASHESIRSVCERLGFRVEAVIPYFAKDQKGNLQPQVIMACTLDEWFHEMQDFYDDEKNWGEL